VDDPKTRTLKRALETLGSSKALADALGVKAEEVADWLAGASSPHDTAYLTALDIVARGPMAGAKGPKKI
jgi:DNA-binding transcriptional regulator YiaG